MDNLPIFIAIAFFFGAIGILLGFLVGSWRRKRKEAQTTPEPEMVAPPPLPVAIPIPARNTPKDSVEILSVWRNERTGRLLALLETKPLSPSHVSDEQKEKLTQILAGLRNIVGEPPPPPPPPVVPAKPVTPEPARTEPAFVPLPPRDEPSSAITTTRTDDPPPAVDEGGLPPQAEKVYFADSLPEPVGIRQALTANPFKLNVPKSSNAPKSIVEQIDEIFQAKLIGSPFEQQNIQLKEAPSGMTILIGSYKYEGIDAVPDLAIRALIKESAREWNEKVSRKR
jgi:hypothetical protein